MLANRLCGIAVDHGTRAIAIRDFNDAWKEEWEQHVSNEVTNRVLYMGTPSLIIQASTKDR